MPKYLFAYHGGATPETTENVEAVMQQWMTWMGTLGDALLDQGNPVSQVKTVGAGGAVTTGGAGAVSGYSIYQGADIDAAVNAAKGCPIFDSGGSVEVAELVDM